jgi:tetratricopeptide (TPR) repeat protein
VNAPIEKRLKLLQPNHLVLQNRDDALLREIMVLSLAGNPELAVEYLQKYWFHIREGDMSLRDINVDAHLLLGKKLYSQGNYQKALNEFLSASKFPENQQVGKSIKDDRIPQILYYIALAAEKLGDRKLSDQSLLQATQQSLNNSAFLYFQALAFQKMGKKEKAIELFKNLNELGNNLMSVKETSDFFGKFGEQKSLDEFKFTGHFYLALGYAGLGQKDQALTEILEATNLNNSNIWANELLKELKP